MITLYQPPPVWGLPCMSPFCVKLETYLRMARVEYKKSSGNPMRAPKGKIPYVRVDGEYMGDSELIIRYLKRRLGDPLDQHLSKEESAKGFAVQCMVEEHLYFAMAWLRWTSEESWKHVEAAIRPLLPPVINRFLLKKIRKDFVKMLVAQGMGRHSREEIAQFAKEDLQTISVLLGQKEFLLGSQPSSFDATIYAFLIHVLWVPWESDEKQFALKLGNLLPYCDRMKHLYWSA